MWIDPEIIAPEINKKYKCLCYLGRKTGKRIFNGLINRYKNHFGIGSEMFTYTVIGYEKL